MSLLCKILRNKKQTRQLQRILQQTNGKVEIDDLELLKLLKLLEVENFLGEDCEDLLKYYEVETRLKKLMLKITFQVFRQFNKEIQKGVLNNTVAQLLGRLHELKTLAMRLDLEADQMQVFCMTESLVQKLCALAAKRRLKFARMIKRSGWWKCTAGTLKESDAEKLHYWIKCINALTTLLGDQDHNQFNGCACEYMPTGHTILYAGHTCAMCALLTSNDKDDLSDNGENNPSDGLKCMYLYHNMSAKEVGRVEAFLSKDKAAKAKAKADKAKADEKAIAEEWIRKKWTYHQLKAMPEWPSHLLNTSNKCTWEERKGMAINILGKTGCDIKSEWFRKGWSLKRLCAEWTGLRGQALLREEAPDSSDTESEGAGEGVDSGLPPYTY
jgi:hypothetical protein